jgi:type II secretory pathway pseudopilin PulG
LWQSISKLFASRSLAWQGALAAVLLIALAGSWVLVRQFQNQRAERERAQNEEATRRKQEEERLRVQAAPPGNEDRADRPGNTASNENDKNPQPKTVNNKQTSGPAPTQVASLVLLPFNSRDISGTNSLTLQQDTRAVRLQLVFKEESYSRYDVVLRTVGGEQVLHRRGLKAAANGAGKSVTLIFDTSLLRRQDYIMTLNGLTAAGQLEAIDDYYFRVERTTSQATPTPKRQ